MLDEEALLKGAWYALEQSGVLLDNAVTLFDAGDWSTAVGLAMFGREELGRHHILRDFAAEATTRSVSVGEVQAKCADHTEKQANAVNSHVFKPPRDSALGKAIMVGLHEPPSSPAAIAARQLIDSAVEAQRRRLPHERHERRMRAFYVDVTDLGEWERPVMLSREEAREIVEHAVNDYSVLVRNLDIESYAPSITRVQKVMEPAPNLREPRWPKWP